MAYRSPMEEIPGYLIRPVLSTFDFRGRSTRTELLVFMLLPQVLIGIPLLMLNSLVLDLDFDARNRVMDTVKLILAIPLIALFVRRMHDQDRTGWWVLLLALATIFAVFSDNGSPSIPGIAKLETPWWLDLMGVGLIVWIWVLILFTPTPGVNRFGSNPRYDTEPQSA